MVLRKLEAAVLLRAKLYERIYAEYGSVAFALILLVASAIVAKFGPQLMVVYLDLSVDNIRLITSTAMQYAFMGLTIMLGNMELLLFLAIAKYNRKHEKMDEKPTLHIGTK